jgi:hypothetical protein
VSPPTERYLIVFDEDRGMMVFLLCDVTYLGYEEDGLRKILECEDAFELSNLIHRPDIPPGCLAVQPEDFGIGQRWITPVANCAFQLS